MIQNRKSRFITSSRVVATSGVLGVTTMLPGAGTAFAVGASGTAGTPDAPAAGPSDIAPDQPGTTNGEGTGTTAAATDELRTLREQFEAMRKRLEELEAAQKKTTEAQAKAPNVTSKMPLEVTGLLQVHALGSFGESDNAQEEPLTFRLRRGELRLTGKITDTISGTIQLDPAKIINRATLAGPVVVPTPNTPGTPIPVPNINIRERDNLLQEITVIYQLNKGETSENFIDVGQYKIPLGYESLLSSSALPFVERALFFTQRDRFDGGYGDVRDTGIQLRGKTSAISYRIGAFNGFGDRQNGLALSDNKAFLGRLAFTGVQDLEVGASYGTGNTAFTAPTGLQEIDRSVLNLFAAYNKKEKYSFQAEYLDGEAQPVGGTTLNDVKGFYIGGGYFLSKKLEGVLRYDSFDTNKNAEGADVNDILFGLNYYIKGNNAKVQANLILRDGGENAPAALRGDKTLVRTNFQVAF